MARRKRKSRRPPPAEPAGPPPPDPVDVVDGIPDRGTATRPWKYVLLAMIFLGWVAFLIYCAMTGSP